MSDTCLSCVVYSVHVPTERQTFLCVNLIRVFLRDDTLY